MLKRNTSLFWVLTISKENVWKFFKLIQAIVMGGGAETMFNQITFTFSKE